MNFTTLLIHTCDIEEKSLSTSGYEKVKSWSTKASDVACRHDSDTSVKINDTELRENNDDDIFFFNPDADVVRGDRIVYDSQNYDVLKVNKVSDSSAVHHLEVRARLTDNK